MSHTIWAIQNGNSDFSNDTSWSAKSTVTMLQINTKTMVWLIASMKKETKSERLNVLTMLQLDLDSLNATPTDIKQF